MPQPPGSLNLGCGLMILGWGWCLLQPHHHGGALPSCPPPPNPFPIPFGGNLWVLGGVTPTPCSCGTGIPASPAPRGDIWAFLAAGLAPTGGGAGPVVGGLGGERRRPLCPGRAAGGCAAPWPRRSPSCRAPALCSRARRLPPVGKGPGKGLGAPAATRATAGPRRGKGESEPAARTCTGRKMKEDGGGALEKHLGALRPPQGREHL